MYRDLRSFVGALESAGELVRVRAEVSPVLEIATIADLVSKMPAPGGASEAARRTDPRFCGRGGPAVFFERVAGSAMPVLINAYGSYRRMEMALGCHPPGRWRAPGGPEASGFEAIAGVIGALAKPAPPRSAREAVGLARRMLPLMRVGPRRLRGRGACQEDVVCGEEVDLTRLPLLRCWPLDGAPEAVGYPAGVNGGVQGLGHAGVDAERWEREHRGRYITLGGVHTIHARDAGVNRPASHNVGMYRVQLLGRRTMAMHWHMHHDGASHWRSWKARGEPMPVAIALGGPSVMPYAATCPLPPGISELLMAGFLNRGGVRLCRGRTVPLWVPADAEMVIEGYVSDEAGGIGWDPREPGATLGPGAVFEGPFGDHTGFYSLPDRYPILTVTAVTQRRGAIFPATVVGLPPQEDYYLGKATERIMLPLLKTVIHDIEDYDLPQFGAFHNAAILRISKAYPLHARRVMHAVWGAGQMSWTKCLFVVDDDVDVHDTFAVMRAAATYCRPGRDVERVRGPLDILDHAGPYVGAGTKIGFDCTPKRAGESAPGAPWDAPAWAPPAEGTRGDVVARACAMPGVRGARWPDELGGWLLVRAAPGAGSAVAEAVLGLEGAPPFSVVLGSEADLSDLDRCLFLWCAHMDPGRDGLVRGARMAFDATPKEARRSAGADPARDWPPMLEHDAAVLARVRARWREYGLPGEA